MNREAIERALPRTFERFPDSALPAGCVVYHGKVRDVVRSAKNHPGSRIALIASDRISAFDRVLSTIHFKGEVLTRIAAWWFKQTEDILPNHLLPPSEIRGHDAVAETGRCMIGRECSMLPVEVVVRGYLTGSAWRDYQAGKSVSGIALPAGMRFCEAFPEPLITPSTKEASGHDRPISSGEIVASGLVDREVWAEVEKKALAVFRRGQELAKKRGLILVDTKYEFGLLDGHLVLADEIHTPDSSRYWYAGSYMDLFASGEQQRELDKETFRRWLMSQGFSGDGKAPSITDEIRAATSLQYITAYETITGDVFEPTHHDPHAALDACALVLAEAFNAKGKNPGSTL